MALVCSDLCFAYHKSHAPPVLDGIALTLEPGTITAILGPNGSGKSTLVRLLLGILTPTGGSVELDGREVHAIPEPARAARLVYIPQRPSVAFAFSVLDIVSMGPAQHHSPATARQIANSVLERLAMTEMGKVPFSELSVGQQQRVILARALAQLEPGQTSTHKHPMFLLADEPTSAMDPRHALETLAVLKARSCDGVGLAVVLHDLTAAMRLADRVALLDQSGHLVACGCTGSVLTTSRIEQVFGVRSVLLRDADSGIRAVLPIEPSLEPK